MKNSVTFRQLYSRPIGTLLILCMLLPGMVLAQFGPKGTCRAMVVGISEYQDPDIPDLHFAHRDAEAFASYLQTRPVDKVKSENLKLLVNDQATGGNVHSALRNLVKDSQAGDKVVIYFAGHGDVETLYPDEPGHLLVYDTPANNYSSNSLRLDDIRRTVNALVSRDIQVLIVTDACHAGKLAGSAVNGSQAATSSMAEQFNSEVKILSCQSNEFSQEGEQWGEGRGVFSWYLIQGLTGLADADKDLQVTIKELSRYLEDMIEPDVSPLRQTPNLIGDRNARVAVIDEAQLLALRKELDPNFSTSEPAIASREPEAPLAEKIDSVWVKKLKKFQLALEHKKLISEDLNANDPKGISAYDQLQKLIHEGIHLTEVVQLQDQLIAKLQEDAQQAINAYLKNDQEELNNRWKGSTGVYQKYARYLETAAKMIGKDQYLHDRLLALSYYFQAVNLRISSDKILNPGPSLKLALMKTDSASLYESRSAFIANEAGLIHARLNQIEHAIRLYSEALEIAPTWALPYNNLAFSYSNLGQLDIAADYASKALLRDSSLFGSYRIRAEFHVAKNDNMAAEAAYLEAIRRNPTISQPLVNYAEYWKKIGRLEMAEIWYQQVLAKSPLSEIHLYDIGVFYTLKSDFARGIYYFKEVLKRDPNYTQAWFELSMAYWYTQDYAEAEKASLQALEIESNHQGALCNLGMIKFAKGDFVSSLAYYQQALDATPDSPYCLALEGSAAVYLQLGDLGKAKKSITDFIGTCTHSDQFEKSKINAFYNLACIESREGNHQEAFIALKKAIDAGFDNENHIRSDPDLEALHNDPEWERLLNESFRQ